MRDWKFGNQDVRTKVAMVADGPGPVEVFPDQERAAEIILAAAHYANAVNGPLRQQPSREHEHEVEL